MKRNELHAMERAKGHCCFPLWTTTTSEQDIKRNGLVPRVADRRRTARTPIVNCTSVDVCVVRIRANEPHFDAWSHRLPAPSAGLNGPRRSRSLVVAVLCLYKSREKNC